MRSPVSLNPFFLLLWLACVGVAPASIASSRHQEAANAPHIAAKTVYAGAIGPMPLPPAKPKPYLILFGEPKYRPGFRHFAYVNPNAPKGGRVKLYTPNTFDSLNPFILKGTKFAEVATFTYEGLMTASIDEPQSYYPLIAKDIAVAQDNSFATFTLNPKARFQDGTKITAEDVIFSLEMFKTKADPSYQLLYKPFSATAEGADKITFAFADPANREAAIYVATMPILSKAYFTAHPFDKTSLDSPNGSGPYRISKVDAGRYVEFERAKDYWAKDLPTRKGSYNFDTIRYDVYRDETVAMEAFKAHQYDLREEYIARNWATAYNFTAVADGRVKKYDAPNKIPRGMQAFLFNQRKPKFADRRVREAIGMTLDFEWLNHALFFDAYDRNDSFFQNTDFSARERPSKEEIALLEPFRAQLPGRVFTEVYHPQKTNGSGTIRPQLIRAQALLKEAGWIIKDGERINEKTGEKLTLEFMMSQTTFQRVIMPMIHNLQRLGIEARFRLVDDAQYVQRLQSKDFDIVSIWWNLGLHYPGNEQLALWSSTQADVPGGGNLSGLKHPAVDAILQKLTGAKTLPELVTAGRALDRTLLWEQTVIPHWSISHFRTAYWDVFGIPNVRPPYALGFENWWAKPAAAPKPVASARRR